MDGKLDDSGGETLRAPSRKLDETIPAGADTGASSSDMALTPTLSADSGGVGPAPEAVRVTTAIGRFEILRQLGAGGMGEVYLTRDPELDRKVAVKLLHPRLLDPSSLARASERMRVEARAMARLSHPNVVTIYEVGTHEGQLYLAMEYVEGPSLGGWLKTERSRRAITEVFCAAGEGLAAAHEAGLVHRDFKPDNVLVGDNGVVKVTDFGVASMVREWDEAGELDCSEDGTRPAPLYMTRTGELMGTPLFMSPEQFVRAATDARSDQFSFCVALYTALFDQRPFETSNFARLMRAVTLGERSPVPPDHGVPAHVVAALDRGLRREPDERWPSMVELIDALRSDPRRPRARRRKRLAWAVGIGVVAAGAGFAAAIELGAGSDSDSAGITCAEQVDEAIGDYWTAESSQAIRAHFGGEAAAALVERLDGYAQAWREGGVQACERRNVDPFVAQRLSCFDVRREALGDLRDELLASAPGNADARALDRALEAADALPPIARCLEGNYLRATEPVPDDPTKEREVGLARRELARLDTKRRLGDADEASEGLGDLRARVEALDFPALSAELTLFEARLALDLDRTDEADAKFKAAYLAAEAAGHAALVREAGIARLPIMSQRAASLEALDSWAEIVEAKLERGGEPLEWANFHAAMFEVETARGAMEAARHHGEEALRLREEVLGPEHVRVAESLSSLSYNALVLGRHDHGQSLAERALDILDGQRRPSHRLVLAARRNLARHFMARREMERALEVHVETLRLAEAEFGPEHSQVAEELMSMGGIYLNLGKLPEARAHLERALAIHERVFGPEHMRVAADLSMLGMVVLRQGEPQTGIEHLERALKLGEGREGRELERATTANYLGHAYGELGDLDEAERYMLEAAGILDAKLGPEAAQSVTYYSNVADIYVDKKDGAKALEWAERATQTAQAHYPEASAKVAVTQLTLADALVVAGRGKQARGLIERTREEHAASSEASEAVLARLDGWLAEH
ncbi:serine/threonine kinase family protein [Plesiocystis pacifica SIR-1]|uniref:Serine/threonine kinase family protein n=1 Tax=Plesiocystis pacifica SIR-1 TaxID=391625 RepID=A6FYP1_9BACT|nr:serine/threonine-protein kinase [Plesiocystis pacifica]EDM81313.1 serine/threonine kinase family protein [Plesiocystis pacifica SIR-1]